MTNSCDMEKKTGKNVIYWLLLHQADETRRDPPGRDEIAAYALEPAHCRNYIFFQVNYLGASLFYSISNQISYLYLSIWSYLYLQEP